MVSAAIIGTALGGGVAGPSRGLYVNSTDVRLKSGIGGNRYGVPLDTISVVENGPGGVSSMTFTIEDPLSEITVSIGDPILYVDNGSGVIEFRGWVQHFTATVFGLGRAWEVEGQGTEAILDWITVPAMTFAAGTPVPTAVQQALAAGISPGGFALNTGWTNNTQGTMALPMGDLSAATLGNTYAFLDTALTTTTDTLREVIRQIITAASVSNNLTGSTEPLTSQVNWTVDYYFGLRMWVGGSVSTAHPGDYSTLVIKDDLSGANIQAANLQHETDGGGVIRGVYVIGGNANGTGPIMDGTGLPGPIATLEDSTILTSAARDLAGAAYLVDKAQAIRGSFDRQTFTDTSTLSAHIQAGSLVSITDAQVSLTSQLFVIGSITKTYHGGGLETWSVTYGGLPPSLPRALRRLTRAVRN